MAIQGQIGLQGRLQYSRPWDARHSVGRRLGSSTMADMRVLPVSGGRAATGPMASSYSGKTSVISGICFLRPFPYRLSMKKLFNVLKKTLNYLWKIMPLARNQKQQNVNSRAASRPVSSLLCHLGFEN